MSPYQSSFIRGVLENGYEEWPMGWGCLLDWVSAYPKAKK
jgi:hypothetical protein